MQSHANSLAQIESDWTLRDGVNSLISNILCTKQSNLFRHLLNETFFTFARENRPRGKVLLALRERPLLLGAII